MTFRVLSYNIHGGRGRRGRRNIAQVAALLDKHAIDVAVFQEFDNRPSRGGQPDELERLAERYPFHLAGPTMREGDGWFGNLILSRHPIHKSRVHNLETAGHLEPRFAVDAVIAAPSGPLRIIGTHLSLSPGERWREIGRLLAILQTVEAREDHPFFLMGDINEWRWMSRLVRHLDRAMTPLPCGRSFPARFPLLRLDRAWCGQARFPVRARILGGRNVRSLSDHLPLLVEIGAMN